MLAAERTKLIDELDAQDLAILSDGFNRGLRDLTRYIHSSGRILRIP